MMKLGNSLLPFRPLFVTPFICLIFSARALELFVEQLLTKAYNLTISRNSKTILPIYLYVFQFRLSTFSGRRSLRRKRFLNSSNRLFLTFPHQRKRMIWKGERILVIPMENQSLAMATALGSGRIMIIPRITCYPMNPVPQIPPTRMVGGSTHEGRKPARVRGRLLIRNGNYA